MNCYYSNLIEGHSTHPVDIERAMKNDFEADAARRTGISSSKRARTCKCRRGLTPVVFGGARYRARVSSRRHRRFCELLPTELLLVTNPDTGKTLDVIPGALREEDVRVGQLFAISPGAVPRFLERFGNVYGALGRSETILAAAAAHHRLLWIHPFLDGNGRVARLMSHAVLLEALDTGGIWSVARGLARSVAAYKKHLMECDLQRRHDLTAAAP